MWNLTFLLTSLLAALQKVVTAEVMVKAVDKALDAVEYLIASSENTLDDQLLPLIEKVRETFNIPDNDVVGACDEDGCCDGMLSRLSELLVEMPKDILTVVFDPILDVAENTGIKAAIKIAAMIRNTFGIDDNDEEPIS